VSPDGNRLAVSGPNVVHLWDLRRIREQLAKLGLNWDAPPYPPAAPVPTKALEVRIHYASPYVPSGELTHIDLGPKANRGLTEDIDRGEPGKGYLAALPPRVQTFAGVKFNIQGKLIRLKDRDPSQDPKAVEGIQVNQTFVKLHVLHAVDGKGSVADGTVVGQYKLHYEDETEETIPIVLGEDLRDRISKDHIRPLIRGKLAWLSNDPRIGLYVTIWENPQPSKKVVSIDYISTEQGRAAPFCVAITVEGPASPANH
jgi:hypothetical protein